MNAIRWAEDRHRFPERAMAGHVLPLLLPLSLFIVAFGLASLFAWRTPPWLAPDEPAHYAYVEHVARTGRPPVLESHCYDEGYKAWLTANNFVPGVNLARFCYEGHQPPLFYYAAAPVYLLSGGSLLALRLFCAFLGAGVVIAAWGIVRAAGGDQLLAVAVAALVATVPQHLAMLGSLNNDALTYLLVALAVWQMTLLLQTHREGDRRGWLRLGLLLGLAAVTKTLAWVVFPLAACTLLLSLPAHGKRHLLLRRDSRLLALSALFIVPWFARNLVVYGGSDLLGLQRHEEVAIGQPRTADLIAQYGVNEVVRRGVQTTFNSFWGQFGWMKAPLQTWEYSVLATFMGIALLGLLYWIIRRGWRAWGLEGRAILLLALWALISSALLLFYNLEFVQYQGRYLFPALTAFAFFLLVGLGAWVPRPIRFLPWAALLLFLLYLDGLALLERLPGMLNY